MPRRQKQHHYIYKTTCNVTGKFYVGMHSTDNLDDGYLGSGKRLGYSLAKHGRESHNKEILEMCVDREALKLREKELITDEMRGDPQCMNIAPGGGGGLNDAEHAQKFHRNGWEAMMASKDHSSSSKKNWQLHRSTMKSNRLSNQVGENNIMFGKKHSSATREKQSKSHGGEKNSQFGTCWVSNESSILKVRKEQLEEYLANGYSKGRKIGNR